MVSLGSPLFFPFFFFVLCLDKKGFSFFLAFLVLSPPHEGGGVGWRRTTARQGKRDKYRWDPE
jgi:hypothetical protein